MSRLLPTTCLFLLMALSSCAPSGPDPGYAGAPGIVPASRQEPAPQKKACAGNPPPASCSGTTSPVASSPALSNGPVLGVAPVSSTSPAPSPPPQPSLPSLGTPVFGPRGVVGTVVNQTGNTAIVAPVGGGAPGIYVPNGNGTATIFQPGGVPVVVPNPP